MDYQLGENIPVIDTQTAYFNGNIIVTEDITFAGQGIINVNFYIK